MRFFFLDGATMRCIFVDRFDTMVTELAYELDLRITPAAGLRIAGVYGLPGDRLSWTGDGALRMQVETLFLSRDAGAIYVAFAPERAALPARAGRVGQSVGSASMSFQEVTGGRVSNQVSLELGAGAGTGVGLRRGAFLVDEITTLRAAAAAHHETNDSERAYQLIGALRSRLGETSDPTLAREKDLVDSLYATLAKRSGHAGDPFPSVTRDAISGLPAAPAVPVPMLPALRHPGGRGALRE